MGNIEPLNIDYLLTTTFISGPGLELFIIKLYLNNNHNHMSKIVTILGSRGWSLYAGLVVLHNNTDVMKLSNWPTYTFKLNVFNLFNLFKRSAPRGRWEEVASQSSGAFFSQLEKLNEFVNEVKMHHFPFLSTRVKIYEWILIWICISWQSNEVSQLVFMITSEIKDN